MPPFTWSNEYSVGIHSIDQQHSQLFAMMNDLEAAMKRGDGASVTAPLLRKLYEYTEKHFDAEEALMKAAAYPDFERHQALHVALTRKVSDFLDRLEHGGSSLSVDLLFFLCEWLKTHILQVDRAYEPWLTARGAK